jgi:hypothetical protein
MIRLRRPVQPDSACAAQLDTIPRPKEGQEH